MDWFFEITELIALALEGMGMVVILIGFALATGRYLITPRRFTSHDAYIHYRHGMGRSILLGLDFLIAGDIIKTVIVSESEPYGILILGAVVLIRTFLSMTLHLEVEGRWPWQNGAGRHSD